MSVPMSVLNRMKGPGSRRPTVWRNGVLQVKITSFCDLSCVNCSVAVGTLKKLKKQFNMSPDDFRTALRSLKGYKGVIGIFGGNPVLNPRFEEMCSIFREEIPDKDQRGLWSNRLFGKGAICRETFSPIHSNLNVHQSQEAWDEMKRDWPEAHLLQAGLDHPSHHGPIFGSMMDLGVSELEMWEKVAGCYVNQTWSAEITMVNGQLRGYFCEIAATMAELDGDDTTGVSVVPGWWDHPAAAYQAQVESYCSRCLVAMNPRKVDAAGSAPEEYTRSWAPVLATIKGRPIALVSDRAEIEGGEPATKYLKKGGGF